MQGLLNMEIPVSPRECSVPIDLTNKLVCTVMIFEFEVIIMIDALYHTANADLDRFRQVQGP